jgi:hypothetical protein
MTLFHKVECRKGQRGRVGFLNGGTWGKLLSDSLCHVFDDFPLLLVMVKRFDIGE